MPVKLFVGGLSFSTSSDRLREAFAAIGSVESASVVTDRDTGRSRGFGFVEMATTEDANAAVSRVNGTDLDGRQIKVEMALSSGPAAGSAAARAAAGAATARTGSAPRRAHGDPTAAEQAGLSARVPRPTPH